jgi:hypothetical protein
MPRYTLFMTAIFLHREAVAAMWHGLWLDQLSLGISRKRISVLPMVP